MFCPNCGNKLSEDSKFCPNCEVPNYNATSTSDTEHSIPNAGAPLTEDTGPKNGEGIICPRCGCNHCQPHYKQDVSSTGKNYSCLQGGLGMLITGPFGLLCGLCGQGVKTTSTNTLVWVCPN